MKTEAPSNSNRNVEWAVETFRPLLKDLHLQNISKDSPTIIKTANFRNLIVKGMGRCIIAVQRQVISDGQSGYCTFIYNKEYNLYILSIVIDENLFNNDSLDSRTKRKATKFTETNWWKWVREPKNLPGDKILVNTKTRDLKPFYISNANNWDGSLLALVPKKELNLNEWVLKLNSLDWEKLGFKVGGRLIFSQKALFNLVFN